jgi:hypothetical protein
MYLIPERPGIGNVPVLDDTGSHARRLFSFQGTAAVHRTGTDGSGRATWKLDRPGSGVSIFGIERLPIVVSLPGGYTVELVQELVPEANRLGIYHSGIYWHWIDFCLVLRIRRDGEILKEGRRQHEVTGGPTVSTDWQPYAYGLGLSTGFYKDEFDNVNLLAHSWDLPWSVGDYLALEESPVIGSSSIAGSRLAGPFGRGITLLQGGADEERVIGEIGLTVEPLSYEPTIPAFAWFAHETPLEEILPLKPDSTAIVFREEDRLAWGRHRAQVAAAPLSWGLSELEAGGHMEWVWRVRGDSWDRTLSHFPGASPLFDRGKPAALEPVSGLRSNVSHHDTTNSLVSTMHGTWTDGAGWTTGNVNLGLRLGAWNELRPTAGDGWIASSGTWEGPPTIGTVSITDAFLAVNLQRVDATNLGGISSREDAVEVTRYVLRWFAAIRWTGTYPIAGTGWSQRSLAVVLTPADAANLLAGNAVTISGPYSQGTYPTPADADIFGTLTIQTGLV